MGEIIWKTFNVSGIHKARFSELKNEVEEIWISSYLLLFYDTI